MNASVALIPGIPVAGWLLLAAGGKRLDGGTVRIVTAAACAAMFALVCGWSTNLGGSQATEFRATLIDPWISIGGDGGLSVALKLRFDALAGAMLAAIALAGLAVALRGIEGTPGERRRFAGGLLLCLAAASGTILADDFLSFLVLWSLSSLAAGRMLEVRRERPADAAAARSLVLAQRLTDVVLAIGVFSIWSWLGTLDMATVLGGNFGGEGDFLAGGEAEIEPTIASGFAAMSQAPRWLVELDERQPGSATLLAACLLAGAVGRCAQFPIFAWLRDAAKTRPAAIAAIVGVVMLPGVYLLARCTPLFAAAPEGRLLAMALGGMTMVLAGVIACSQSDAKSAVAFAAVSQFGCAFLGLGLGTEAAFVAAVMLGTTHAAAYAVMLSAVEDRSAADRSAEDADADLPAHLDRRVAAIAKWSFASGAVLVASGLWGAHAIFGELWNASAAVDASAADGDSGPSPAVPLAGLLLSFGMAGLFLASLALSRAFVLGFLGNRNGAGLRVVPVESEPISLGSRLQPLILAAAAAAPLWGAWKLLSVDARPFGGGVGLPIALAGMVCGWWGARAGDRLPTALRRMLAPVSRLGRHRFYLEDVFFLGIVLPLRAVAQIGRFVDWFLIDGLLVGLPARLAALAARGTAPLREMGARFYLLSMVLATAVLLGVLMWRS
ncbi:MAG: proton-conducting transporter membrane subunit [Planctomycetaceae bacterium]